MRFKGLFSSRPLDTFPYTALEEESCEPRASLSAVVCQEDGEAVPPLAMLKKVLHAAATIVVFAALAAIALQVLCTEAYVDSGILTLKVRHRCLAVSSPAHRKN